MRFAGGGGSTAEEKHMPKRAMYDLQDPDSYDLVGMGTELIQVHPEWACVTESPDGCPIHAPSDHHMVAWDMHWNNETRLVERICAHGLLHPDPDSAAWWARHGYRWPHPCACRCCVRPE
jgi:hypothetical protein